MSPIGKIFAVVNLILAAAFLGWASNALATSAEYKSKYESEQTAHAKTKQDWEAERSSLTTRLTEAESSSARFRQEKEDLANDVASLTTQVKNEERINSELRANLDKIGGQLGDLVAQNKSLEEAKSRAMQGQNDAERARDAAQQAQAGAEAAQRAAQQQVTTMQRDLAAAAEQERALREELASLDARFKTLVDRTGANIDELMAQPLIEGRVLDVNKTIEPGLVALNVGSDAGVQRGFTFEVYRGRDYLGQVRVENVRPSMSTALIVRTYEGRDIRQGDMAATRL
jgi:hypothetical protein